MFYILSYVNIFMDLWAKIVCWKYIFPKYEINIASLSYIWFTKAKGPSHETWLVIFKEITRSQCSSMQFLIVTLKRGIASSVLYWGCGGRREGEMKPCTYTKMYYGKSFFFFFLSSFLLKKVRLVGTKTAKNYFTLMTGPKMVGWRKNDLDATWWGLYNSATSFKNSF